MATNKDYRLYKGYEEAMYFAFDIANLIDEVRCDIEYVEVSNTTFQTLEEIISIANQVKQLISKKEEVK